VSARRARAGPGHIREGPAGPDKNLRIRQHVNPLKSNFFEIPLEPLCLPSGVPVEVELGSAEAHFLMDRAAAEPAGRFIGVEIRREMVDKANAESAARGLPQVRSVFANMSVDLPRLFPEGRVRRFFLNFPDPWFKAKQHKRRVVSPELVLELHRALEPSGEVHVNTDIFDLALDAMAELEEERPRRFVSLAEPWSFLRASRFEARSRRERECEAKGIRIWRLAYRRI
jgi:tRNA (guanine-N7-)-methyltransferase